MEGNKITRFPGMYDLDMDKELYLVFKTEISEEKFNAISGNLGYVFPDGQVIQKGSKFYLLGDVEGFEEVVKERLKAMNIEYPTGH